MLREPPVVHVYDVVECGRRWYRSIAFSSDAAHCLHTIPRSLSRRVPEVRLGEVCRVMGSAARRVVAAESVTVSQKQTAAVGAQLFMPARLLYGLLPSALLEAYHIWQNEDGSLAGYERVATPAGASTTELRVELLDGAQLAGAGGPEGEAGASAQVKRFERRDEQDPLGVSKSVTLVNLLLAPHGSALRRLSQIFVRLDNLSHVLAWVDSRPKAAANPTCVDLVELPRLRLTFRAKRVGSSVRLLCEQHEGFFVSHVRAPDVVRLLEGVPHSLLLEREDGSLSVLVSAGVQPKRVSLADPDAHRPPFPSDLDLVFPSEFEEPALDGGAKGKNWLGNLGPSRHYMLPVHRSRTFLFYPTLASALYMLLLRLLARQYEAAASIASQVVCDSELTPEEQQICEMLAQANDDHHPDAHACRLLVSLSALHTPLSPLLPWDLSRELAAYVLKHPSVSVPLRLAASEEELLLDHACSLPTGASAPNVLNARREMLTAAAAAAANGTDFHVTPLAPSAPVSSPFDAVSDRSCIESEGMGALLAKFTTLSYSRPENMVGIPALQALDRWIGHGLELRGGKDEKGFLFLYELMRGDVLFKLRNDDSSLLLGFMLIRTLPPSDTQNKDVLMSILRVLANNGPSLTRLLPKFEDDRRVKICAPQHI